jgi:hypothetical protein
MQQKRPDKTAPAKGETREDRLKAALKANMARRKAQALARTQARAAKDLAAGDDAPRHDADEE